MNSALTPPAAQTPAVLRRLVSMLYDTLLLLGVLAVTLILPHVLLGMIAHRTAAPALVQGHLFLVLLVYFGWFWLHGGQTLAMKTWAIRLENADGGPVRPLQALLRYLLAWPSVCLLGVGVLWALMDRDGQFLHDRLSGTRLVRCPRA